MVRPDLQRVTVLMVDDDPATAAMVSAELVRLGFAVRTAHSGTDALAIIREDPGAIDVLLSHIGMPGMGGLELADTAREIEPRLPILLLSGFADMSTRYGPLMAKPFKATAIVAMIERMLSPQRRAPRREVPGNADSGSTLAA